MNIATEAPLLVLMPQGLFTVQANIINGLALHHTVVAGFGDLREDVYFWTVTHAESGLAVAKGLEPPAAIGLRQALLAMGIDWTATQRALLPVHAPAIAQVLRKQGLRKQVTGRWRDPEALLAWITEMEDLKNRLIGEGVYQHTRQLNDSFS